MPPRETGPQSEQRIETGGTVPTVIINRRVILLMDFSDQELVRIVFANYEELLIHKGTQIIFKNKRVKIRNIKL